MFQQTPKNDPDKSQELTPKRPEIVRFKIPIAAGDRQDEQEVLLNALKKHGFLGEEFRYSSFPSKSIDKLLETGTYRFTRKGAPIFEIFCCQLGTNYINEVTIVQPSIENVGDTEIFDYFYQHVNKKGVVGLAIYHLNKLQGDPSYDTYNLDPERSLEALAAVALVRLE